MTNIGYMKCEKHMNDAFELIIQSEIEYENHNLYIEQGELVKAEIEQRKADQHYGEALGINRILSAIGFKNERMVVLHRLL